MRRASLVTLCCAFVACTAESPKSWSPTITYVHPKVGLVFELPTEWQELHESHAWIYAGPPGTDAYYTTIVLQSRVITGGDAQSLSLPDILAVEMAPLATSPQFAWGNKQLTAVDTTIALAYTVEFEYNEQMRRKSGLMFRHHDAVIDISYNAPVLLFAAGFSAFAMLTESLTLITPSTTIAAGVAEHL